MGDELHRVHAGAADHADWWNVHIGIIEKLDEMRSQAGDARVSLQHMVALVPSEDQRAQAAALATRRFGTKGVVMGNGDELVDHFGALGERGVERTYAWFCDFAQPATLAAFGESVIAALR